MHRLLRKSLYIIYKSGDNLVDNDGIELAGYLTFLSLLSLFPFLVLIVAAAGFVGQGELGTRFIELTINHLPSEAFIAIQPRIEEIISGPPQGLLTISILGAIWTSSSAVEGLRTVLNRAYQVSNPPTYLWRRLMSIVQLIIFTVILVIVMSTTVLYPLFIGYFEVVLGQRDYIEQSKELWNQYFLYFGAILLLIVVSGLYYFLPNIKQSLLAVIPGAALVVMLWLLGASLFSVYIANVDQVNIIYGSLGGFIATLLFFFILNLIFIYGAEFNNMLIKILGTKVEEKEHVSTAQSGDISLTDKTD